MIKYIDVWTLPYTCILNVLSDNSLYQIINWIYYTDSWIITGGTNCGVMELVGESVRACKEQKSDERHKMVVIGIATSGAIAGNDMLKKVLCIQRIL